LSPRAIELLSGPYREDGNSHLFIGERGAGWAHAALRQLQTKRIGALKAARPGSPSSLELPLFVTAVTALDSFHVQDQGAVPWGTAAGSKVV
jgi:hypothetical protein